MPSLMMNFGKITVAFSLVKRSNGILFEESFDFERSKHRETVTTRMRQAGDIRRRREHIFVSFLLDLYTSMKLI